MLKEKERQFFMGLDPEQFGNVGSNLLAMEPLPTLNKAYATLLREERQQLVMKGLENKTMIEALTFQATAMNKSKVIKYP